MKLEVAETTDFGINPVEAKIAANIKVKTDPPPR